MVGLKIVRNYIYHERYIIPFLNTVFSLIFEFFLNFFNVFWLSLTAFVFKQLQKPSKTFFKLFCGAAVTKELLQRAQVYLKINPKFTFTKFILNNVLVNLFTCKLS